MLTWYNGSTPLDSVKHVASLLTDGTYVTQSKVRLTVSRHDHGRYIRCEATNEMPLSAEDPVSGDVKEGGPDQNLVLKKFVLFWNLK